LYSIFNGSLAVEAARKKDFLNFIGFLGGCLSNDLLLLITALQPLVGFGLLYDFIPQLSQTMFF
jgi:hypothetical protein